MLQAYFSCKEKSELLNLKIQELTFFGKTECAPTARCAPAGQRHLRGFGGVTPGKFLKYRSKMVHSG